MGFSAMAEGEGDEGEGHGGELVMGPGARFHVPSDRPEGPQNAVEAFLMQKDSTLHPDFFGVFSEANLLLPIEISEEDGGTHVWQAKYEGVQGIPVFTSDARIPEGETNANFTIGEVTAGDLMASISTTEVLLINPGSRHWLCIPGHVSFYQKQVNNPTHDDGVDSNIKGDKGNDRPSENLSVQLEQGGHDSEYRVFRGYLGDQAEIERLMEPIARYFDETDEVKRAWYAFTEQDGEKGFIVYLDVPDEEMADKIIIPGVNAHIDDVLDEMFENEKVSEFSFIDFKALELQAYATVQGVPIEQWLEQNAHGFYDGRK